MLRLSSNLLVNYEKYSFSIFTLLSINLFTLNIPSRVSVAISKNKEDLSLYSLYNIITWLALLYIFIVLYSSSFFTLLEISFFGLLTIINFEIIILRAQFDGKRKYKQSRLLRIFLTSLNYVLPFILLYFDSRFIYFLGLIIFLIFVIQKLSKRNELPKIDFLLNHLDLITMSITIIAITYFERIFIIEKVSVVSIGLFLACLDLFSRQNIMLTAVNNLLLTKKKLRFGKTSLLILILAMTAYILGGFFLLKSFKAYIATYFKISFGEIIFIWIYTSCITLSGYLHVIVLRTRELIKYSFILLLILSAIIFTYNIGLDKQWIMVIRGALYLLLMLIFIFYLKKKENAF